MGTGVDARARAIFHGKVQGVWFRAHCKEKAEALGLRGYVRNLSDGTVEAVFEGPREIVEACIRWNEREQPNAVVSRVEVRWEAAEGTLSRPFEIRR